MSAAAQVVEPCSPALVDETVALLEAVWSALPGAGPITTPMLHTLLHAGACVLVARDDDGTMRGAVIAFRATDRAEVLHLHVVGVAPLEQGSGLGRILMSAVREWACHRDFRSIEWTFDPLVRRNAHLYLRVLGAQPSAYLLDPYGELNDAINEGQGSDRLLVSWHVTTGSVTKPMWPDVVPTALAVAAGQEPRRLADGFRTAAVEIPADIESLRERSPELARAWRRETRALLGGPTTQIMGFDDRGRYVVAKRKEEARAIC